MRSRTIPLGARHLRTYMEFESYLADFVGSIYPFLWIVARPGITKTESIKAAVRGHRIYYRKGGQLTPAQFYIDGYHHRGRPIILDDAEHLLKHKTGEKLISDIGDTSPIKLVCYGTTSHVLGDIPQTYYTTSPLCVIANRPTSHEAIQSRAITLYFDPMNLEVHRAVAAWYWDQAIHDWFGQHLYRLPPLDTRWYVIAERDKRAGRDWQQIILKTHALDRASCVVQDLESNPAYPTREDKARRFLELLGNTRGASRASYFRLRRRLEEGHCLVPQVVPTIPLRRTTPPGTPSLLELESGEMALPIHPHEEADRPLDVPAREQFSQPISGDIAPPTAPARPILDDSLPWERPVPPDDEGGDE